ncbi:MAG: cohesin domain-containing protein [Candidatus Pacebacteria bacterium]|nr:cohesin domain-containing protein [Candidatus Paceibacterota bacterium]
MQKSKLQFKIKKSLLSIFTFSFLFLFFYFTNAANLYFEPAESNYAKGDTFIENLILDTQNETINAIEAKISYSVDLLEVKEISTGNSILELWTNQPSATKGIISFSGGKPDGYKGKDGKIISIVFRVLKKGKGEIKIDNNARVLLNDGKGTETKLETKSALINTTGDKATGDEWEKLLKEDKTPPQPFKIKLSKDSFVFDNQYFISFATTDKETGIDYYEVLEVPLDKKNNKVSEWVRTESPYLLKDQSLKSEIMVKAVDKAGNERIEKLNPQNKAYYLVILILLIIFSGVIFLIVKKRRKRN